MRVIAGKYRSRRLQSLPGFDLRPTADRLRETLFNILTPGNPSALEATTWIDLFAGTGAVGIEALSRGAGKVYFVEASLHAADLIRKNLQSLNIVTGAQILREETLRALRRLESQNLTADFIFLDPPYSHHGAYRDSLSHLSQSPLLTSETIVIVEHQKKFDPGESAALPRFRTVRQGDAALSFYRKA